MIAVAWTPFNLSAVSGEATTIATFCNRHTLILQKAFKSGTQLDVDGIPVAIPANTNLKFASPDDDNCCNCIEVVTATITTANATTVDILPITTSIPCEYVADVGPIDLSDRTYRAECRETDEDDSPILFTMPCVVNAAAGTVSIRVDLTTEPVNTDFESIPHDLNDLQAITKGSKLPAHRALAKRAYSWNLACQYTGAHPQAPDRVVEYMGFFWVVARGRADIGSQPLTFP